MSKRHFVWQEEFQTLILRYDTADGSMSIFGIEDAPSNIDFKHLDDAPIILGPHGVKALAHALLAFADGDSRDSDNV